MRWCLLEDLSKGFLCPSCLSGQKWRTFAIRLLGIQRSCIHCPVHIYASGSLTSDFLWLLNVFIVYLRHTKCPALGLQHIHNVLKRLWTAWYTCTCMYAQPHPCGWKIPDRNMGPLHQRYCYYFEPVICSKCI